MNRKRWFEPDSQRNGPITLFDFNKQHDRDDVVTANTSAIKSSRGANSSSGTGGSGSNNKINTESSTWRIVDDSFIGGYSTSSIQLHQQQHQQEEDDDHTSELSGNDTTGADTTTTAASTSATSFIRWEGIIDGTIDDDMATNRRIQRSGFANLRSPQLGGGGSWFGWGASSSRGGGGGGGRGGFNLDSRYNGLEIVCRQPHPEYSSRLYTVNLVVESEIPDDMYQCVLHVPESSSTKAATEAAEEAAAAAAAAAAAQLPHFPYPSTLDDIIAGRRNKNQNDDATINDDDGFHNVVVLFQHFMVTSGGKLRTRQRSLDNRIKIQSIGFTVGGAADHTTNGPFTLDIARIRAINYDGTGIVGKAD